MYKSGWVVFVHHLETVAGFTPSSLDSHLPVLLCSVRTTFILLRINFIVKRFTFNAKIVLFFVNEKNYGNYLVNIAQLE